jgi:meiotic recombination protein SPO11
VSLIHETHPSLPTLCLVDYDPDGLNIFRCYRYGSSLGQTGGTSGLRWLGIKTEQLLELGANQHLRSRCSEESDPSSQSSQYSIVARSSVSSTSARDSVTRLSTRDRKLAIGTLGRLAGPELQGADASELKMELQRMLMLGIKMEIQWLDESGNIEEWLNERLQEILN